MLEIDGGIMGRQQDWEAKGFFEGPRISAGKGGDRLLVEPPLWLGSVFENISQCMERIKPVPNHRPN